MASVTISSSSPSRLGIDYDLHQVTLLLLSATVLGITAYFGSIFLPNHQRRHRSPIPSLRCANLLVAPDDFGIFSLIVPSLTILVLLIT